MKKYIIAITTLVFILILSSCTTTKTDIITTLYPHYDIARQISGDKLTVSIVTPFGSDAHDFEPSSKQIVAINEAKLFIYTSSDFDNWVGSLVNNENAFNTYNHITIDSKDISTIIHYWTDPLVFIEMINVIANEIIKIDPNNKNYYEQNKLNYIDEITNTHLLLESLTLDNDNKTIYFAGHNALGGFASRYNINIIALIDDFKPEADHTIKDIEKLISGLKNSNSNHLFIEELVDPRVAKVVKNELEKENLNITLLELHGYHNITKEQSVKGVTYADLFKQNYKNLKQAFN